MGRREPLNGLDFYQQSLVDQEINPKGRIETQAVKFNVDGPLSID